MPLPFALDHINLWLIADEEGWTAVDTGYATDAARALWRRICGERLGGRPIRRIVVTHYHPDHVGLAHWLTEHCAAPLWMTEKEWRQARALSGPGDFAPLYRAFAGGAGTLPPPRRRHEPRDRRAALAGHRRGRSRPRTGLPLLPRERRADRRRSDPAADLAEHQPHPARARRRSARPLSRLARQAAPGGAAGRAGPALAQPAVLRPAPAD